MLSLVNRHILHIDTSRSLSNFDLPFIFDVVDNKIMNVAHTEIAVFSNYWGDITFQRRLILTLYSATPNNNWDHLSMKMKMNSHLYRSWWLGIMRKMSNQIAKRIIIVLATSYICYTYMFLLKPTRSVGQLNEVAINKEHCCSCDADNTQYKNIRTLISKTIKPDDPRLVSLLREHFINPPSDGLYKRSYPMVKTPQATTVEKLISKVGFWR